MPCFSTLPLPFARGGGRGRVRIDARHGGGRRCAEKGLVLKGGAGNLPAFGEACEAYCESVSARRISVTASAR